MIGPAWAVTTAADVAYFRVLVAHLEAGGDGGLWDLVCARRALVAVERRWAEISSVGVENSPVACGTFQ